MSFTEEECYLNLKCSLFHFSCLELELCATMLNTEKYPKNMRDQKNADLFL